MQVSLHWINIFYLLNAYECVNIVLYFALNFNYCVILSINILVSLIYKIIQDIMRVCWWSFVPSLCGYISIIESSSCGCISIIVQISTYWSLFLRMVTNSLVHFGNKLPLFQGLVNSIFIKTENMRNSLCSMMISPFLFGS